jgi:site-specific DNA recombinase
LPTNDNYQEYFSQGGEIIKNIANRYATASPIGRKQIIDSIFAEKLIFSENKFRTTEPNIILELISRPRAGSDNHKKQKVGDISDLSALVPSSGNFTNQLLSIISNLV